MDINAASAGTSGSGISGFSPSASKKASDDLGMNKALNQGAIVSGLLPALSSGNSGSHGSSGISGLSDIYTAVGMQTQGMMSRGLMGIQIANISLGIDMSQAAKDAQAKEADIKDADAAVAADKDADEDSEPTTAPDPDAARYYSNPAFSNPGLGGLLNSLG